MRAAELGREALRAIRAHALRSFLTLLGIIIGVATLVGVVSVISGLDAYVRDRVIQLAPDVFMVQKLGIIRSSTIFERHANNARFPLPHNLVPLWPLRGRDIRYRRPNRWSFARDANVRLTVMLTRGQRQNNVHWANTALAAIAHEAIKHPL